MTTIDQLVTDNWPVTEEILADRDSGVTGFTDVKTRAIARAGRELYETEMPDDADVPMIAKQWIADKATVRLIPTGIDYYATRTRKSDNLQNMTITYYDRVRQLQDLRAELEADCLAAWDAARNEIEASDAPEQVESAPAVSLDGALADPTSRAYLRGPY